MFGLDEWLRRRRWTKLKTQTSPQELSEVGICLRVRIEADGINPVEDVFVQIDPGAEESCFRPGFIESLGIDPIGWRRNPHFPEAGSERIYRFRVKVVFPTGTERIVDGAVLSWLNPPYDMLIGRDILSGCRLSCDFTTGKWELHFKNV
jgi:hypothetical protein